VPELATEAWRSFLYALRKGYPFQFMTAARRAAAEAAGLDPDTLQRVVRLPARGRANLHVSRLHYPGASIVKKTVVSTPEFRVAQALASLPAPQSFVRIYHVAQRGPVFHIFLEDLPEPCGAIAPERFARLAHRFCQEAGPPVAPLGLHRRAHYGRMDAGFLRRVGAVTGHGAAEARRGLDAILVQPWAIQHNDLHRGNIGRRRDDTPCIFDFGTVGLNLLGADLSRLLPRADAAPEKRAFYDACLDTLADLTGSGVRGLHRAALLHAGARELRFARRHRDGQREDRAAARVAEALGTA
jgi:hypothetical protein